MCSTPAEPILFTRGEVPPLVAALVVHYGSTKPTEACLGDLSRLAYPRLAVFVVDNDPSRRLDRTAPWIGEDWEIFTAEENLGYCRAVNIGLERALSSGAEYVLLLNNDVRFEPGFLAPLVEALEADEKAGSAAPRIVDPTGRIWSTGGFFRPGPSLTGLRGLGRKDRPGLYSTPDYADYFPGACVLHRASALEETGLLDEDYWMYMEDLDLAMRMRQKGYKALYVPWSRVVHAPSSSTGGGVSAARKYYTALNSVRFLRRWGTPLLWSWFLLFDVLGLPAALLLWSLKGGGLSPGLAKAKGILHGMLGRSAREAGP